MEVLPFLYIILVFVLASTLGNISILGWWPMFMIALLGTPLLAYICYVCFPKRPKVLCIKDFNDFEAGKIYHFTRKFNERNEKIFALFNGFMIDVSVRDFSQNFSEIKNINEKA